MKSLIIPYFNPTNLTFRARKLWLKKLIEPSERETRDD
jgi:hypothetical protein